METNSVSCLRTKNSKQKFQKILWTKVLPIKHGENFQSPKNVKVPETNFVDKGVMVKNVKVPVPEIK